MSLFIPICLRQWSKLRVMDCDLPTAHENLDPEAKTVSGGTTWNPCTRSIGKSLEQARKQGNSQQALSSDSQSTRAPQHLLPIKETMWRYRQTYGDHELQSKVDCSCPRVKTTLCERRCRHISTTWPQQEFTFQRCARLKRNDPTHWPNLCPLTQIVCCVKLQA